MTQRLNGIQIIDDSTVKVHLIGDITRGENTTNVVTLKAPNGGQVKDLMQDMLQIGHTESVQKVVSRTSQPQITRGEFLKMGMGDIQALREAVRFFYLPPAAKKEAMDNLQELGLYIPSDTE
jgi:hypothetical protein